MAKVNKSKNTKNLFVEVIMLHCFCEDVVRNFALDRRFQIILFLP